MSQPEFDNWLDSAYGIADYSVSGIVIEASNIRFGNNPAYGITDFLAIYPQFGTINNDNYTGLLPQVVLQSFINLASASINIDRWFDLWNFAMSLYVAHFATLYLQAQTPANATAKQVVSAGINKGILVSKAVGNVSASYQPIVSGFEQWGSFNLTSFGQQLITFGQTIGMGGMYVY